MGDIPDSILNYIEGLTSHDVDRIAAAVADDVVFVTPARTLNKAQFLAMLQGLYSGFPDWCYDHDSPQWREDVITVNWRQGGTHTGILAEPGLPIVPATGRAVQIHDQNFFYKVRDNKIIEIRPDPVPGGAPWGLLDQLGMHVPEQ